VSDLEAQSFALQSADGLELFGRRVRAPRVSRRWTFVVEHGLGEHGGRYERFAAWFASRGAELFIVDIRGNGRSGGPRGHAPGLQALLDDLDLAVQLALKQAGRPLVLVGHSTGGEIGIAYALAHPEHLDRAVFSAPSLKLRLKVPAWKRALGRVMPAVMPRLTLPTGLDASGLTHDPLVNQAYIDDALVHDQISARFNAETFAKGESLIARAPELNVPFLLLQGGDDPIVDPDGGRRFFERATAPGRASIVYPGQYHEIFNEPEQEQVFSDILAWLEKPIG
jgi:alpha-beta hydrolase superfamily lysophospholipase